MESWMVGVGLAGFIIGLFGVGIWAATYDERVTDRERDREEGRANVLARKVQADLARRMGQ